MIDRYTYSVTWSQEDKSHVGLCTEFPSLSWLAPTLDQAFSGIRYLVKDVVTDMEQSGESIPEPEYGRVHNSKLTGNLRAHAARRITLREAKQSLSINPLVKARLTVGEVLKVSLKDASLRRGLLVKSVRRNKRLGRKSKYSSPALAYCKNPLHHIRKVRHHPIHPQPR